MAEVRAVYKAIGDFSQLARSARAARHELERLQHDTSTTQADYVEGQKEVKSSTDDSTRSHTLFERVLGRVRGTMTQTTRTQEDYRRSTVASAEATDRHSASLNTADRAISAAQSSLARFNRTHREYQTETRTSTRDTDRVARSMRAAGGDGDVLTGSLGRLSAGFVKARIAGKNFGAVLGAMKIPAIVAGVQALISVINALAAGLVALIPRLVQASGIMAGLPGILLGFAQGAGVAILGFKGIGDAVKALSDRQSAAAQIQADHVTALGAVEDAEQSLADAQGSVQDAQESLTQAREDAREALQDLRIEAERAKLGEEGAQIGLIEARRNLRELQRGTGEAAPTDLDLRSAVLQVREAELSLQDARHQNQRTTEDLRESERKGVEQSDQVVAARDALTAATNSAADAQQNLADAMNEATGAGGALTSQQQKIKDAFRALTPEARDFARQLFSMRDLMDELRATAQRGLLPGASEALTKITRLFPEVRAAVGTTARVVGEVLSNLGGQISSPVWRRDLVLIFQQGEEVIGKAGIALGHFLDIMRNIVIAARPVTQWIADTVVHWLELGDAATTAGRAGGKLQEFFYNAIDAAEQLGRIIGDTFVAIKNIFEAGAEVGGRFWDSIEEGAQTWRDWTESVKGETALREWFEAAEPVIHEVARLLGDIGRAFFTIAKQAEGGLVPLIQQIRTQFLPALIRLGNSVSQNLLPAIVELLTNVVDLFAVMGGQSGGLATFVRVLNTFLDIVLKLLDVIPGLRTALNFGFIIAGAASAIAFIGTVLSKFVFGAVAAAISKIGNLVRLFGALRVAIMQQGLAAGIGDIIARLTGLGPAVAGFLGALAIPVAIVTAFAVGVHYLIETFGPWKKENEEAARAIHTKLVPALLEQNDAVHRATPEFRENAAAFLEISDGVAGAEVTNKDFARVLTEGVIPALDEGSLSQEEWNKWVDEANDRGYDAIAMLEAYRKKEEEEAEAQHRANVRMEETAQVLTNNAKAARAVAGQMGLSFKEFREQALAAAEEGGPAFQDFLDRSLAAIKEWRLAIQENFDGVSDVLSEFSGDEKVSADEIEKSFEDQIKVLDDYQDNWAIVDKRLGPHADAIRQAILDMGLDGAGFLEGLAGANDKQFNEIIGKWRDTKDESGDLATTVEDELAPAMDRLADILKNLPDRIAISLGIDVTPAKESMNDFLNNLHNRGITIRGAQGGRGLYHSGGPAGAGPMSSGPPRGDEVDARLQKGEYVMSREAVKGAGGMSVVDRMHERFKRRKKFHTGGGIGAHSHVDEGDNIDDLSTRVTDIKRMKLTMVLPAQKFDSPVAAMPTGPLAGAGAGGMTPNATYAARVLRTVFPEGLSMGGKSIRTISGSSTWSQHAYGNAWDIFSPVKQAIADFLHANASVLKVAELIYNHQDSWKGGAWGPYTGTTNPHTDHVHVDFWPWYTGDPYSGGYPVGYAKGGRVKQKRAMAHKDEFVLQRGAAAALGEPALNFLNTNAGRSGPAAFLEAFNQSFAAGSMPRLGGVGSGVEGGDGRAMFSIAMHLDGKTVSRSVDVHSREADILLPGR